MLEILDRVAETQFRVDDNMIRRTAICIPAESPDGRMVSFDILAADGSLLARINAYDFGNGAGDVDVIAENKQLRALAWWDGTPELNQTVKGSVVAVDIRGK